jgi:beta-mannosidase
MKHYMMILAILFVGNGIFAKPVKQEIHSGWKFKQARLTNRYPATVPGVVHLDLMDNSIIEDPFFRLNERGIQWIDKEDWIYETRFDVSDELFSQNNLWLHFDGLDTYADVYLNNTKVLEADNMFRRWSADVKDQVKRQGNVLKVYFHSPIKVDIPKWNALPYPYKASNDQSENGGVFDMKLSVLARKAGYHYGWDWGPRIVTSGIWRPVVIEGWSNAIINNVQIIQNSVTDKSAKISAVVEVTADHDADNYTIDILDNDNRKTLGSIGANLKKGLNKVTFNFDIKNPELWWSNGLGKPHLYNIQTVLNHNGSEIDSDTQRIGIRSLKLIRENDKHGQSFYFELNGVPVFAKGANYVPLDNFLPRVTKEKYKKTILDAVDVNMNMLRVWGGGIYEDDYFYDLCDEYGILVWQDFMFACSIYPAEGELLENIRREAIDNVRRLRNHPSIAIWCGNNECQDALYDWGWKEELEKLNPDFANRVIKQFEDQYYVTLASVVEEYGSDVAYTPSSPFSGYGIASNDHQGDRHYWGVWHGQKPISDYNTERSRFFSEYGFQSFPEFESVKIYAPKEEDWNITSEVMMAHQRGGEFANKRIESYLLNEYYTPKDFQSFLYLNQLLQGDAVKTAIETHRRDRGYCMGSLFWQHNDCWPVASWSSRDYYGRWKAQHYFSKYAFKDILVSPIEKEGILEVYIVSDRLKDVKGELTVNVLNFNGEIISAHKEKIAVKANSSNKHFSKKTTDILKGNMRSDVVIQAKLSSGNETYYNNYFLEKQKDMHFPKVNVQYTVTSKENGYEIAVTADKFARAVLLSMNGINHFFSDNYFDIFPEETKIVRLQTSLSPEEIKSRLKAVSITDSY